MWVHPTRLICQLKVVGAIAEAVTVTPVDVERRLRVGDARVVERVVVPWSAPHALFEWASEADITLTLEWRVDLRPPPPGTPQDRLKWRQGDRTLIVSGADGASAFFALSRPPSELEVQEVPGADGGAAILVRGRLPVEPGDSVRLAAVGGAGPVPSRSVRAAGRVVAAVRAREARVRQAVEEGLSAEASDRGVGDSLARARLRIGSRLVALDGGHCLVAGYGALGLGDWRTEVRAAEALEAALASLALGDFEAARETLVFLGKRRHASGRVPSSCTTTGVLSFEGEDATPLYLLLAGRYLAWTGDIPTIQAEWPRLIGSFRYVRQRVQEPDPVWRAAVAGLALAAESVGEEDGEVAGAAGGVRGVEGHVAATDPDAREVLELVEGGLGVEPDATKGRLVLRPRPPVEWTFLRVRSLRIGAAAVGLDYRKDGGRHRFVVSQGRGSAPLQLILEPELTGRLEAAVVDGAPAELDPVAAGERTRVPVQLALDHPRTVELEMAG